LKVSTARHALVCIAYLPGAASALACWLDWTAGRRELAVMYLVFVLVLVGCGLFKLHKGRDGSNTLPRDD
jgi:hypothetical protein